MFKRHQSGGELVEIVRLLDAERPLSNTQLKVNTNEKGSWIWRIAVGRMKLIVWNAEDATLIELGDCEKDIAITGLSTDHMAWPLAVVSIIPTTFNFEEGRILIISVDVGEDGGDTPPTTLKVSTGENSSTITTSKVLSHPRLSPTPTARPLKVTLKILPSKREEP
jgi:hypothetical protein